jgi:hypothetical protein
MFWLCILLCIFVNVLHSVIADIGDNGHPVHPIFFSMALLPFGPWPLFQFLNLYTVGGTPWTEDQNDASPLPIHRTIQTQNKRVYRHPFEATIRAFERAKTGYVLDPAVTVIGVHHISRS